MTGPPVGAVRHAQCLQEFGTALGALTPQVIPDGARCNLATQQQVVVGSDHPIPWDEHPIEVVLGTPTLSEKERVAILGGTATKLFRLDPLPA